MSKIRIKNFGPIKNGYQEEDGWMEIKKITVFVGNQGSGKSSIAKLISTFTWIEKALTRGDYSVEDFTKFSRFKKIYCGYHKLENYFLESEGNPMTEIEYQGEAYFIKYQEKKLFIEEKFTEDYYLPQIMYVPAERNFLSTIKNLRLLKLSSSSLVEFLTEFDNAKNEIKGALKLPINNVDIEYDKLNDIINVKGETYKLRLTEASSGFQSVVPLYIVSRNLANSIKEQSSSSNMSADELKRFKKGIEIIWGDTKLTDEQRRAALSVLSSKFKKSAFINIVEEPEQNLYPSSQRKILNSLIELNNLNKGNKLIITTHSPYMINYLSIAIQGHHLKTQIVTHNKTTELLPLLNKVLPNNAVVAPEDVVIYELDEIRGGINKLRTYEGIPSDKNLLNTLLGEGNRLFDYLLEIEENL